MGARLTLAGAQYTGIRHDCRLARYMHTLVYEVPSILVKSSINPVEIQNRGCYCVKVVSDPLTAIQKSSVSNQYKLDKQLREALGRLEENVEKASLGESNKLLFVVAEYREEMKNFPVDQGQCRKIGETLRIAKCDDARYPSPLKVKNIIDADLTSVKAVFGVQGYFKKHIDQECYQNTQGETVYSLQVSGSAQLSVWHPLEQDDVYQKAEFAKNLRLKIKERGEDKEMITALQRGESEYEPDLRLWYLRLWGALERFGEEHHRQISNDASLTKVKEHRNHIAHYNITEVDRNRLRELEKRALEIFKTEVERRERK